MKKTIAIILALVLCLGVLAACGNSEQAATSSGGSSESSGSSSSSSGRSSGSGSSGSSAPAASAGDDEDEDEEEEMAEINVALMCFAPMDQNATGPVADAINEIIEPAINVHANISWFDAATYGTQIPMQIQAGEKLDVIMFTPVPGSSYVSYRSANQLMDISDLIDEYGPDVKARLGDLLLGTSYGDAVYGITHYNSKSGHETMYVRKDLADASGVTADLENAKSWSDMKAAFEVMTADTGLPAVVNTDAEGTVLFPIPFMIDGDSFSDAFWYDAAGDGYNLIMIDESTDTVRCYYETEYYDKMCEMVADWYKSGLVYKDAATAQDYSDTLVKSGVGYAEIRAAELGSKESSEAITGYELVEIQITPSKVGTNGCTKFGYGIPVTSDDPEAAMKYLNYLYTEEGAEVVNILTWGLPGRDWVVGDDGMATYPDGVSADSVQYHTGDFLYGDQIKVIPWEGSDPNLRAMQQAEMDNAPISKYMGFTLSTEGMENTATALNMVLQKYKPALASGSAPDWQATLAAFRDELKANGIDDLLAAYQAQLDAWLADNG